MRAHGLWVLVAIFIQVEPALAEDVPELGPSLVVPGTRGGLAGELNGIPVSPDDLSRGTFHLTSPFELPTAKAAPLVNVFPTYSPSNGVSEWGMGWKSSALEIRRSRPLGHIAYDDVDDLSTPWGVMRLGTDGSYYSVGLGSRVKIIREGESLKALQPDGETWAFKYTTKAQTPAGIEGVYSWHLSEVTAGNGQRTTLTWDGDGPYLNLLGVAYGIMPDDPAGIPQYRVNFDYETLGTVFEDYRPGSSLVLRRRVSRVIVSTRTFPHNDIYEERYHYNLKYDPTQPLIPYLTAIDLIHPAPIGLTRSYKYSYQYPWASRNQPPPSKELLSAPKTLSVFPNGLFLLARPEFYTPADINIDGITDLEDNVTLGKSLHDKNAAFVYSALSPIIDPVPSCTVGPENGAYMARSRALARMRIRGNAGYREPHVVQFGTKGTDRKAIACQRSGLAIGTATIPKHGLMPAAEWGVATRLVDWNIDRLPDIVAITPGGELAVVANGSGTESPAGSGQYPFRLAGSTQVFFPKPKANRENWQDYGDMNGDGIPDLVEFDGGDHLIKTWLGPRLKEYVTFPLPSTTDGKHLAIGRSAGLYKCNATVVDINADGRADPIISCPHLKRVIAYVNLWRSDTTSQAQISPEILLSSAHANAFVGNMRKGGRTDLIIVSASNETFTIPLRAAGDGLLNQYDDGRGNRFRYAYEWGPNQDGAGEPPVVLASLRQDVGGVGRSHFILSYRSASLHSRGGYFIGYQLVNVKSRDEVTTSDEQYDELVFDHDDELPPRFRSRTSFSGDGRIFTETMAGYEKGSYKNVPFVRPTTVIESWGSKAPSSLTYKVEDLRQRYRTDFSYSTPADFCVLEAVTSWGESGSERSTLHYHYVTPVALADRLTCIAGKVALSTEHPDSSLNSQLTVVVGYVQNGLPESVAVEPGGTGPAEALLLSKVTYDSVGFPISLEVPGRGTTKARRRPYTVMTEGIQFPSGADQQYQYNLFNDALENTIANHGQGVFSASYTHDPMGRPKSSWNSLSGSVSQPLYSWDYRDSSYVAPGYTLLTTNMPQFAVTKREASIYNADGSLLTLAQRSPSGWALGPIHRRGVATPWAEIGKGIGEIPVLESLTYKDVLQGFEALSRFESSSLGFEGYSESELPCLAPCPAPSMTAEAKSWVEEDGSLVQQTYVSGVPRATVIFRPSGLIEKYIDELGHETLYSFDLMGRLRAVTRPDGSKRSVHYDSVGRISEVGNSEGNHVSYTYKPGTTLVEERIVRSKDATRARTETRTYTPWGALAIQRYSEGNDTVSYEYDYGSGSAGTAHPGPFGSVISIRGAGFSKSFAYAADQRLERSRVDILSDSTSAVAAWRRIETQYAYYPDGRLRSTTVSSTKPGSVVGSHSLVERLVLDPSGRPSRTEINGVSAASYTYDNTDVLSHVSLPDASILTMIRDPKTGAPVGFERKQGNSPSLKLLRKLDAAGRVVSETRDVAGTVTTWAYQYDATGRLAEAKHEGSIWAYKYDISNRLSSINGNGVTTTIVRTPTTIVAGTKKYELDAFGSVVTIGASVLQYGPDGQVRSVGSDVTYVVDELGHRIARRQGTVRQAYLEDSVFSDDGITKPIGIGEIVVGWWKKGKWVPVTADLNAIALQVESAAQVERSPFGARSLPGVDADDYAFAMGALEPMTGAVRLGVRDYLPELGQFLQPDPLYDEVPEVAVLRPSIGSTNYAANDPINLSDPSGLFPCGADACIGIGTGPQQPPPSGGFDWPQRPEGRPDGYGPTPSGSGSSGQATSDYFYPRPAQSRESVLVRDSGGASLGASSASAVAGRPRSGIGFASQSFLAGAVDFVAFGVPSSMGWFGEDMVNSRAFQAGQIAGAIGMIASGAWLGRLGAGTAIKGVTEFSHAVPGRFGRWLADRGLSRSGTLIQSRNILNGNYVTPFFHALSDSSRYVAPWGRYTPRLPLGWQMMLRVPMVWWGTAGGVGAAWTWWNIGENVTEGSK